MNNKESTDKIKKEIANIKKKHIIIQKAKIPQEMKNNELGKLLKHLEDLHKKL